jgi:outer membrane protein OmpA-like peptidoglycan-associated protein
MIMKKVLISLLLITTAVCTTPASANYFSNPALGMNLNIGSAPNPKPADLRVIETTTYTAVPSAPIVAAVEPAAPTPAPLPIVAEAPPAPPPPPAINRFIVFFDFDKSNLTAESMQVVALAVKTAKDSGMVRITVTGHTDTVGSQRYNQALSERRAGAVKTEMVRLGMGVTDVTTIGKSFLEPLVATGPGVREPQNRRAMIDLGYNLTATLVPSAE